MSIRRSCPRSVIHFAWPLCALLVPALVAAQETEPRLGDKEAAIEAALAEETAFEFTDQPLHDVVEFLQQKHKLQIHLDGKALADAGMGTDTTVSRKLHAVKLSSALDLFLSEFDLTFVIRDEVLMITTKAEAENILSTRVYPVADLVAPSDDDLVVGGTPDFDSLIELIASSVGPTTWAEAGGPGTIQQHRKSLTLVVSQTYEVHREIGTLLESLRVVDRRRAEQRRDAQLLVAEGGDGLQLKVYKLPAKWLFANAAAPQGNPSAPAATLPATTPSATPDEQKPATSPAPMPQLGGGMGGGMRGVGGYPMARINLAAAAELAESIPDLIEPESWEGAGGDGVIRAIHGTLVVRQTADVHRQICRLLQALN